MVEKENSYVKHQNSLYSVNRKLQYICEYKVDEKIIDRKETDDYDVWYDKIIDRVYEVDFSKEIEIKIKICKY